MIEILKAAKCPEEYIKAAKYMRCRLRLDEEVAEGEEVEPGPYDEPELDPADVRAKDIEHLSIQHLLTHFHTILNAKCA